MAFEALDVCFGLIRDLRVPTDRIAKVDRDLSRQIRRAASSIALNIAEGRGRTGGDRLHAFRVAHGSACEVDAALRVALGWGYVTDREVESALATIDRVRALAWRLAER